MSTTHHIFGAWAFLFTVRPVFDVFAGVTFVGAIARARFGAFFIAEFARAVSSLVSAWNIVA